MCLFKAPSVPAAPELPEEPQEAKQPDAAAVRTAVSRRVGDRISSGTRTILTSGEGVTDFAPTEKKTLLGQ